MADLRGFDARQIEPAAFEPIPAGKYLAVIIDSEMRPTKAGDGHYLYLTFEIIDGQYKGRQLWARLNLDNPNPTAKRIAQAELAAICRAVSVFTPNDSAELHNLPLVIHVRVRKRPDTGELVNEIKGYSSRASAWEPPGKPAGAEQQDNKATPPWKR